MFAALTIGTHTPDADAVRRKAEGTVRKESPRRQRRKAEGGRGGMRWLTSRTTRNDSPTQYGQRNGPADVKEGRDRNAERQNENKRTRSIDADAERRKAEGTEYDG